MQTKLCLTQKELARRWAISHRTLERWRWTGEGPDYLKLGGRVIYRLEDITAFEAACITDALHIERIEADSAMAERLLDKAGRIIFAQHPPGRISEDPAWFECRFCDHQVVCHEGGGAAVTCRSCLHATPVDGGWHCARHDRMLAALEQRAACTRHLFIPDLVPGEVIDAGDDVVIYRMADGSTWANDARNTEATPC